MQMLSLQDFEEIEPFMRSSELKVGVFHPPLNVCGGAEWVAVKIIEALKCAGHEITVLTDEKIDQDKISKLFGSGVHFDTNLVFPFRFFSNTDLHNIYTDAIRFLLLKSKCNVVIDTQSNAILPWVNMVYIHYPLFGRLPDMGVGKLRSLYYLPYRFYERKKARSNKPLILSNSNYTAEAIRKFVGATASVLYPPIPEAFFANDCDLRHKEDLVVSFARISPEKRLSTIPCVARLTNEKIRFLIIGTLESPSALNEILRLAKENNVSDRVKVMTSIPLEEARQCLRKAKVFFHPTRGEHFGITIVEAMASGCIPVVHNSGGPKEFVPDLFRFDEPEQAADKINKAVLEWSPQLSRQFTKLAQPFSEEVFYREFLRMFNSYIERNFT
jgi:glycosyltransferase involved in cell wall biosynthesis